MQFPFINDRSMIKHYSLRKIYEYASERSELEFWHFHILKLLFPSIYFVSETYIFRSQITSAYILYNKCRFLLLLMVWHYINDSTPTKHYNCEKSMYMRASLEIFGIFT